MTHWADRQFSFEFFPPRDAEQTLVYESTRDKLARLRPAYMSVTFGAGGSTTDRTRETVLAIQQHTGIAAAPHISCQANDRATILRLLADYQAAGITRLVVLRGDQPSGSAGRIFRHAAELVGFIRAQTGEQFHIDVACYPEFHPESVTPDRDLEYFRRKVTAGANGAITQYFFNADAYFDFVARARRLGVDIPIVPGIMPVTNYRGLARFSSMCGAEIPLWIRKRLEAFGDDGAAIREFGTEVVTRLCERLLEGGAPGLHFYTLNRANATLKLWRNLGLPVPTPARGLLTAGH